MSIQSKAITEDQLFQILTCFLSVKRASYSAEVRYTARALYAYYKITVR
jgi:hypothetical protein